MCECFAVLYILHRQINLWETHKGSGGRKGQSVWKKMCRAVEQKENVRD